MKKKQIPVEFAEDKFWVSSEDKLKEEIDSIISSKNVEGVLALKTFLNFDKEERRIFLLKQNFRFPSDYPFISMGGSFSVRRDSLPDKKNHPLSSLRKNSKITVPRFIKNDLFPIPKDLFVGGGETFIFLSWHMTKETILTKDFVPMVDNFLENRGVNNFNFFLPIVIDGFLDAFWESRRLNQNILDYLPILSLPKNGPKSSRIIPTIQSTNRDFLRVGYHEEGWAIPRMSIFWTLTDKPICEI